MNRLIPFLIYAVLSASLQAGQITEKPLDEFVIYDIPVASKTETTTIMFPLEISGLFAKSVAAQEPENAGFFISFTPGRTGHTHRADAQTKIGPVAPARFF